ncbi:hypothetical protein [Xenorhabdus sp. KJ12.1]|uniref:hypothetical protein n=1 Tax=Xenorhabdus sp. KJ12.1 TaxID=1851571 RepID=UPI000C04BCDA|nr:hypothetical protein [Xenorhabdus sp. KJ12.1]PHM73014.1 hypothetical protein Xekj_00225 [Xenorhabdus sp. KJ12.1]
MSDKITGNAALLRDATLLDELAEKYDSSEVASVLVSRAINNSLPNANTTPEDVASFSRVANAFRTGEVNIEETVEQAEQDAAQVVEQMIADATNESEKQ